MIRCARTLIVLGALSTALACGSVKPHQRETLAKPALKEAPWPSVERADQHVFEVREGSTGATGSTGGGCGCN